MNEDLSNLAGAEPAAPPPSTDLSNLAQPDLSNLATPQQPPTIGQTLRNAVGQVWQGQTPDPMINMGVGAWKQALGALGGIQKIVNDKLGVRSQPSDVIEYKQEHPDATDSQALDAVSQGYRGPSSQAAHAKAAARADWLLRNSDPQGFAQSVGGFAENMSELALAAATGQPEAGARSAGEIAEQSAKLWRMMEGNNAAARLMRIGWAAVKNAGEQGAQTYVHTGGDEARTQTAAEIGGGLGTLGQVAGEGVGAYRQFMGRAAEEVQPTVRDLEGAQFRQLASEARGPSGEPLASPRANVVQVRDYPDILRERTAAWKQLNTNLAKKSVVNALEDTNNAINASGVADNIRATAPGDVVGEGDRWRYIPPDGSTALSSSEARSAMDNIKQEWLSRETTPQEDEVFRQAYDDIQQQLARHDSYLAAQPFQLHDPAAAAAGVENWRDAANHLDMLASTKIKQAGASQDFQKLVAARDAAQDTFDRTMYSGDLNEHIRAQQELRQTSDDLANYIKTQGAEPQVSPVILQRAFEEQQAANGLRELQNVFDSHMTLRTQRAQAINRPQEVTGLGTLTDDLEKVQSKYGDVLNPILGNNAFNHLIELGDLMESPRGTRADGLLDNITTILKKQYYGGKIKGALSYGGGIALGHFMAHSIGGPLGGLGVLGARTYYLRTLRQMATNPEIANAFIQAAKSDQPISVLGPQLARLFATAGGFTTREGQNATR